MPSVTIDGRTYDFEGNPRLLQFCQDHGIEVPHFCYHPSMSIPANCRQCLVDVGAPVRNRGTGELERTENGEPVIRYFPKLQTSCSHTLADGQVIHTKRTSDKVKQAQKDNLELMLINHPLDCPICDQAGMCPLQIQAYKYGPEGSRFEFRKTHKPKKVKLGPRVVLDAERCINCTRCTRFTDEVSKSHQLTIIERGVKNYPMTPPGIEFDDPYSMNVIDICPVGALTSADFRFQARIWEMSSAPSITTSNATGANCYYWVRDNLVLRVTPRHNPDVNEYWLPDEDRLVYQRFNEDRPDGPELRMGGNLEEASWDAAIGRAAAILGAHGARTVFLASAHATVEDNYLLTRLAAEVGGRVAGYLPHVKPGHGDGWLRTDDRTPNAEGCRRLGIPELDVPALAAAIEEGEVAALYVLEDDPVAAGALTPAQLRGIPVILHYYNTTNKTAGRSGSAPARGDGGGNDRDLREPGRTGPARDASQGDPGRTPHAHDADGAQPRRSARHALRPLAQRVPPGELQTLLGNPAGRCPRRRIITRLCGAAAGHGRGRDHARSAGRGHLQGDGTHRD